MTTIEEAAIAEMRKDHMLNQELSDEDILIALNGLKKVYEFCDSIVLGGGSFDTTIFDSIEDGSSALHKAMAMLYIDIARGGDVQMFMVERVTNNQLRGDFLEQAINMLLIV